MRAVVTLDHIAAAVRRGLRYREAAMFDAPGTFQRISAPFFHSRICSAPGSLDTSLSHAAGLIEIAACHA